MSPRELRLPHTVWRVIAADVRARTAEEACGLLIGRDADGVRDVVDAVPLRNEASDPAQRYRLDARALRACETDARARGCDVVGAYHSHPGGVAEPSDIDREQAWPWYTYLIVGTAGDALRAAAWELAGDRSAFVPQRVREAPWA